MRGSGSMISNLKRCPFSQNTSDLLRECGEWCALWMRKNNAGICALVAIALNLQKISDTTKGEQQ